MGQLHGSGTGNWNNAAVVDSSAGTQQGRLWVQNADGLSIARGQIDGVSVINKFGNAPDFDTEDSLITIWDGADDAGIDAMQYTYSTTNDINSFVSDTSTDTQVYELQGLGVNYEQITQNVTAAGSGYVPIGSPLLRIFRIKNLGTTDNAGHIFAYVSGATTEGVPDTSADVRAIIQPTNNQTLMSIYTIPSGCTAYMDSWYASTAGAKKTTSFIIEQLARPSGGVFQIKHKSSLQEDGSSNMMHNYLVPKAYTQYTDIEIRAKITAGAVTAASISAGFDLVLVNN